MYIFEIFVFSGGNITMSLLPRKNVRVEKSTLWWRLRLNFKVFFFLRNKNREAITEKPTSFSSRQRLRAVRRATPNNPLEGGVAYRPSTYPKRKRLATWKKWVRMELKKKLIIFTYSHGTIPFYCIQRYTCIFTNKFKSTLHDGKWCVMKKILGFFLIKTRTRQCYSKYMSPPSK